MSLVHERVACLNANSLMVRNRNHAPSFMVVRSAEMKRPVDNPKSGERMRVSAMARGVRRHLTAFFATPIDWVRLLRELVFATLDAELALTGLHQP